MAVPAKIDLKCILSDQSEVTLLIPVLSTCKAARGRCGTLRYYLTGPRIIYSVTLYPSV